jgi:predicted oxidoreductase (fatty acid repression mutant protein)
MPSFNQEIWNAVQRRRSMYHIGNRIPFTEEEITKIVTHCVKYAPSPSNCQSARVVILFGRQHTRFWELVKEVYRPTLSPERFGRLADKVDSRFASGYGTILFFEDQATVVRMQKENPLYAGRYTLWSNQSSGMLQYSVWTSLEANGLGASLQHYHPPIEGSVRAEWNIPAEWVFMSQMPFGNVIAPPDEKTFLPIDMRLKVYK